MGAGHACVASPLERPCLVRGRQARGLGAACACVAVRNGGTACTRMSCVPCSQRIGRACAHAHAADAPSTRPGSGCTIEKPTPITPNLTTRTHLDHCIQAGQHGGHGAPLHLCTGAWQGRGQGAGGGMAAVGGRGVCRWPYSRAAVVAVMTVSQGSSWVCLT